MDLSTIATIASVLASGIANLLFIAWKASDLNTQVQNLAARLARIEGHEEERSNQRASILERIARLEAVQRPHPMAGAI